MCGVGSSRAVLLPCHSMDSGVFFFLVLLGSTAAGFLGALTGLGGGAVLTPFLVLGMGVDLKYAVGASLVAVIGTSSGAAAAYVREGYSNIRIGILLETATVSGALLGAYLAGMVNTSVIAVVFSLALFWSALSTVRPPRPIPDERASDPLALRLRLESTYPGPEGLTHYRVHNVKGGLALMFGAGVLSALAGIGSGVVKVLAMDRLMRLPFKVSTTTSNFMIGVTAAASAGVYFHRGQLEPLLCAPVMLGSLAGSLLGARVLHRIHVRKLRVVFAVIVTVAGLEMLRRVASGTI